MKFVDQFHSRSDSKTNPKRTEDEKEAFGQGAEA